MNWPANLLDASYASMLLNAATQREYELTWTTIRVTSQDGQQVVEILFSSRPLRVGGVFVNVSATVQQQIADVLGALLPTPKIMDIAWLARSTTIAPAIMPVASTSAAMIKMSALLDKDIALVGSPTGVIMCQKTWGITNELLTHPGKAMNVGYYVVPNQANFHWNGIATEACVSFPLKPQLGRTIQGPGYAHASNHLDDSQCAWFVHRSCTVNGVSRDVGEVLTDPATAGLLSHEGPLKVLRQPDVSQFACPIQLAQFAPAGFNPATYGLCPTPEAPPAAATTSSAGTVFAAVTVGIVTGVALVAFLAK